MEESSDTHVVCYGVITLYFVRPNSLLCVMTNRCYMNVLCSFGLQIISTPAQHANDDSVAHMTPLEACPAFTQCMICTCDISCDGHRVLRNEVELQYQLVM